jgi:hypothetical protein
MGAGIMGRALRAEQFSVEEISIVHVTARCVRRAFLAGLDQQSGKDYGHRREWIRRRMEALASVFGIDLLSYSVLSNHLHLLLRNRPDVVAAWSDREVAIRWLRVFPGRHLEEYLGEPTESQVESLTRDTGRLAKIRLRLSDISWFMRALCEPIARMANKEEECSGRFWEGRFKAKPVVDEAGQLACAVYVDLNPIRAAMAETLEQSIHTSAYDRIKGASGEKMASAAFDLVPASTHLTGQQLRETPTEELRTERRKKKRNPTGRRIRRDAWLSPLPLRTVENDPEVHRGGLRASDKGFLGMDLQQYLQLLKWIAKDSDERELPDPIQKLLERLGIEVTRFRDLVWQFPHYFSRSSCVGSPAEMQAFALSKGRRWARGHRQVTKCFA